MPRRIHPLSDVEKEELEQRRLERDEIERIESTLPDFQGLKGLVDRDVILAEVRAAFVTLNLEVPAELVTDFDEHFPKFRPIKGFTGVHERICRLLQKLLADEFELGEKYVVSLRKANSLIRLRLAIVLGFDADVIAKKPNQDNKSDHDLLIEFLEEMSDDKEEWSIEDLAAWKKNEGRVGAKLVKRIRKRAGTSVLAIRRMLRIYVDVWWQRKRFVYSEQFENNCHEVKAALVEFLEDCSDGQEVTFATIFGFRSRQNHINGQGIARYCVSQPGGRTRATLEDILGEDAALLDKVNFRKYESRIESPDDARGYLVEFLKILEAGDICGYKELKAWISLDGLNGEALYDYIRLNFGPWGRDTLEQILGDASGPLIDNLVFPSSTTTRERFLPNSLVAYLEMRDILVSLMGTSEEALHSAVTIELQRRFSLSQLRGDCTIQSAGSLVILRVKPGLLGLGNLALHFGRNIFGFGAPLLTRFIELAEQTDSHSVSLPLRELGIAMLRDKIISTESVRGTEIQTSASPATPGTLPETRPDLRLGSKADLDKFMAESRRNRPALPKPRPTPVGWDSLGKGGKKGGAK